MYRVMRVAALVIATTAVALSLAGCGDAPASGVGPQLDQYTVAFEMTVAPPTGDATARLVARQVRVVDDEGGSSPVTGKIAANVVSGVWSTQAGLATMDSQFKLENVDVKVAGNPAKLVNVQVASWVPDTNTANWVRVSPVSGIHSLASQIPYASLSPDVFAYQWQATPANANGAMPLTFNLYATFAATN